MFGTSSADYGCKQCLNLVEQNVSKVKHGMKFAKMSSHVPRHLSEVVHAPKGGGHIEDQCYSYICKCQNSKFCSDMLISLVPGR